MDDDTLMILDSHFHYPSMLDRGLEPRLPEEFLGLEIAIEAGDLQHRASLLKDRKDVFLSMGSGPWVLDRPGYVSVEEEVRKLRAEYALLGADAIGEIGFDNHWGYGTKEAQRKLFVAQAELAGELDLPYAIHTRDADEELLSLLPLVTEKTILHCFSSGPEVMEKLLARGAYISFAGNVTYKSNKAIRESARLCPRDRILYETDSPYLTPSKRRGEPNRPEYTEFTLDELSKLRGEDREDLKKDAIRNFRSLFGDGESKVRRDL